MASRTRPSILLILLLCLVSPWLTPNDHAKIELSHVLTYIGTLVMNLGVGNHKIRPEVILHEDRGVVKASDFRKVNQEPPGRVKRSVGIRVTPVQLAGAAIKRITPDDVYKMFEDNHLDLSKGHKAKKAQRSRDFLTAGELFLNAMYEKINETSKYLSATSGGCKQLKSFHDTYLREVGESVTQHLPRGDWDVTAEDQWRIEDHHGKVALKARGDTKKPGKFIRAHSNGTVGLDLSNPLDEPELYWRPFMNYEDKWCFLSIHGTFLSARKDGSVSTAKLCLGWEQFTLDTWMC